MYRYLAIVAIFLFTFPAFSEPEYLVTVNLGGNASTVEVKRFPTGINIRYKMGGIRKLRCKLRGEP
jgi:hypothetical protein